LAKNGINGNFGMAEVSQREQQKAAQRAHQESAKQHEEVKQEATKEFKRVLKSAQ